ncbi:MAG: SIR2 family protein [Methylococcales bacterium]|nr:SIR2 family protein [Methylococcales bacterium]
MKSNTHCPYRQSSLLQQVLSPDKMRIAFLLGAGCPYSIQIDADSAKKPLIPDIRGLTKYVSEKLSTDERHKDNYQILANRLSENATIEDILSHLRSLQDVVKKGDIDGLTESILAELDTEICKITTQQVNAILPEADTPYHQLAKWIQGIPRAHPIELFTPNYDLLIEQALEKHKIPYFDGFVGARQAFFDLTAMENETLPSRWARLWKVHGSINWWSIANREGELEEVIRQELHLEANDEGKRQMIYPSHLKYAQSRRMPYLAMQDRLRAFLSRGQAVLFTCGYSFIDQHLNEVILNGLRSNPTAVCFALLYGPKSNYPEAIKKAKLHPNLSLLAGDGAVLGGIESSWHVDEQTSHPLHDVSVKKDGEMPIEFLLGDFIHFGNFLDLQLGKQFDHVNLPTDNSEAI